MEVKKGNDAYTNTMVENGKKLTSLSMSGLVFAMQMSTQDKNWKTTKRVHLDSWRKKLRSHRDLNSDRWIQSPEC